MEPKVLEIVGENAFPQWTRVREGCRGIVVREGKLLLSRETVSGWWLVPGGGLEPGETPEACCAREVLEETGCLVRVGPHFLTLRERYEEYLYLSRYYACQVQGWAAQRLTDQERVRGLTPAWLPLQEAVELFGRHQEWAAVSEEKRGAYLREYTALRAYIDTFQGIQE